MTCKESLSAVGPVQSLGTRIACIPVHRLCKDARLASPKRTTAVAECSPHSKHATRSCEFNKSLETSTSRADETSMSRAGETSTSRADTSTSHADTASICRQSVNTFHEFQHAHIENQVPQKIAESKEVDVKVKTPEKCCKITSMKKTLSPPIATDLCSVTLSRIVIPEKSDFSRPVRTVSQLTTCKDTPVSGSNVPSKTTVNPSLSTNITDNNTAFSGETQSDLSLLPVSIMYPSCEQNVFLGSFGLANKAELPQLKNAMTNQLHREAGGKLRRSIKPNMALRMVHRRTNSMRCGLIEDSADRSGMELSSRSLQENSAQSVHTSNLPTVSIKKLSSALSKRLKSSDVAKIMDMDTGISAESCITEMSANTGDDDSQSSLSILADMALAHLETTNTDDTKQITPEQNAVKKLSAKSKVGI